jgi:REP element-mobilizing transposase RayT
MRLPWSSPDQPMRIGCPILRVFCEGWPARPSTTRPGVESPIMPKDLVRYQHCGSFHFLTFSCYQREPLLKTASACDLFEREFEVVRIRYGMVVAGYVLMPEHVHLLVSEPTRSSLSVALQVLKQQTSRKLKARGAIQFWQRRRANCPRLQWSWLACFGKRRRPLLLHVSRWDKSSVRWRRQSPKL